MITMQDIDRIQWDKNKNGYMTADEFNELCAAARRGVEVNAEIAQIRDALTGDDYASLPSDLPTVRMAHSIRADHDKFRNQVRDTCRRAEKAEAALQKINAIRNSIVGFQAINWSEHIYPLVAALNEAGIEGQSYPEARKYAGNLVERIQAAEATLAEAVRREWEACAKIVRDKAEKIISDKPNKGDAAMTWRDDRAIALYDALEAIHSRKGEHDEH